MKNILRIFFMLLVGFPFFCWSQENSPSDEPAEAQYQKEQEDWGKLTPGTGWLLGKGPMGEAHIGAYILARYLNQLPADQSFTDHLGREQDIDTRQDIQIHRIMMFLRGWLYDPKLRYQILFWTVNSTAQDAIVGSLTYDFSKYLTLGAGVSGLPGVRSLNFQHPYFISTDRLMAEEFFRPFFTSGAWANGIITEDSRYRVMVGNNSSMIDVNATKLDREMSYGGTWWWMPSTGEFGPRGGYGDFEDHRDLATRFGMSYTHSREDRFSAISQPVPENTTLRLSDSLNLFETDALAPGVTVQFADYDIISADAGMKYQGFFFQAEFYWRKLGNLSAVGGALPVETINDKGACVQTTYMLKPKKLELIAGGSYIEGHFNDSWELVGGLNYYPYNTRDVRVNGMILDVHKSPVSSLFGYYVGGQTGTTIVMAADLLF